MLTVCLVQLIESNGCIINIGSAAHKLGEARLFSLPQEKAKLGSEELNKLSVGEGLRRYGSSKLLLTMFSFELQRRLQEVGEVTLLFIDCQIVRYTN